MASPPDNLVAALFYGNDSGLISERATQLALVFTDNLDDVFSVTRLTGDILLGESELIVDSAAAIPAFGNRRLVLVKGRGTELLAACKLALSDPINGAIIIVEASETTTKHAIVKLFETSNSAASVGCYTDNSGDIRALATSIFTSENIIVSDDALDMIANRLGSDRALSRREIEKLVLMAGPNGKLDTDEVHIALFDSASLAIDNIVDALASGDVEQLQQSLQKAWHEDASAVMIVRACQGYFRQLGITGYVLAGGQSAENAILNLRPPPHFKLKNRLKLHLRYWQPQHSMDIVNRLQDIESHLKSSSLDVQIYTTQSLLGICLRAPRQRIPSAPSKSVI